MSDKKTATVYLGSEVNGVMVWSVSGDFGINDPIDTGGLTHAQVLYGDKTSPIVPLSARFISAREMLAGAGVTVE